MHNQEKNVQLYDDVPDLFLYTSSGQVAISFFQYAHAPVTGEAEIKKLVKC